MATAQTIPNGGFENWTPSSYNDPLYYQTSNTQNMLMMLPANVTRVTDPQQGTYALRMTTVTNGQDTSFGYCINGDPNTFNGGIPYNQRPVTLTGYYKCNIPAGDTGIILVIFKQGGVPVSFDGGIFTGTHNVYTPFSVTLNIPISVTPDSVIVGAASSNAYSSQGIPGSMLQIDNLVFGGVPSQPAQLNGSFENWVPRTEYLPTGWTTIGDTAYRSTNAHSGTYCLRLANVSFGGSNILPGVASTGQLPPNSPPVGGRPYSQMIDTLTGWYKFTPTGTDSATVFISCTNNGNPVGGQMTGLPPAATWTYFSVPFMCFAAPDTLQLTLAATYNNLDSTNGGNVLFVDDVQLKSSPLSTGPDWNRFGLVKLFPNPSTEGSWLEWNATSETTTIRILDETGRVVSEETVNGYGAQRFFIDTNTLAKGAYTVALVQENAQLLRRLIVQ